MTSQLSTQPSLIESIEVTNLGDFIMVTVLRWWWQNRYVSDFISKMSPTHPVSNIRHQHWCNQVYCVRIQDSDPEVTWFLLTEFARHASDTWRLILFKFDLNKQKLSQLFPQPKLRYFLYPCLFLDGGYGCRK